MKRTRLHVMVPSVVDATPEDLAADARAAKRARVDVEDATMPTWETSTLHKLLASPDPAFWDGTLDDVISRKRADNQVRVEERHEATRIATKSMFVDNSLVVHFGDDETTDASNDAYDPRNGMAPFFEGVFDLYWDRMYPSQCHGTETDAE